MSSIFAQHFGPQNPSRYQSVNRKHANVKTIIQCSKRNAWCDRSSKLSSRAGETLIFMFYEDARPKKRWKNRCQQIIAKLSSRLHESSILTICWGQTGARKWLLQELSERQGDGMESQGDTKMRQDFAKKLKRFTSATFWLALSLTSTENNTFPKRLYSKIRKCQQCYCFSKVLINT